MYHNQSVSQVCVLQLAMKIRRKLDTPRLFYDLLSNYILYYAACMNRVHYHTKIVCSVLNQFPIPMFYSYLWAREPLECNESYIPRNTRLWRRSCGNFKYQFATVEWEPRDL